MATGDTIPGAVKLFREENDGSLVPLTGDIPVSRIDSYNNSRTPEEEFYINASLTDFISIPGGASEQVIADAQYLVGETIVVKLKASSNPANDLDVDAESITIETVREEKARGRKQPDTLGGSDNEVSTNPDTPVGEYTEYFRFTVPDETEIRIAGEFAPVPVEA